MRQINCDIVIVGAGPAGSLAAKSASSNDTKVILIEEHPEVGKPVYCAEGVSLNGLKDAGIQPEPGVVRQKISKAHVYAPNGTYVELTSDEWVGYALDRTVFDNILAEKAVDAGAELMLNTRAVDVIKKNQTIVGVKAIQNNEEILLNSKIVIGADGHASLIRRKAGFDRYFRDYVTCAQYTLSGLNLETPEINEFYLGEKYAPGGYAWVFSKSFEEANVGLGVRVKHNKPAIEYLKTFIKRDHRFENSIITKMGGGICPVSGVLEKIVDEGIMLAGDAAGQLIPMTGAGIHTAIEAGKIAGKVAAEAIKEEDISIKRLSEYPQLFERYWGKRIRESRKIVEMLDKFNDEDLNNLAAIITKEDVFSLANGTNIPSTLTRIFARSPLKLMRLMKAYLS